MYFISKSYFNNKYNNKQIPIWRKESSKDIQKIEKKKRNSFDNLSLDRRWERSYKIEEAPNKREI